MTQNSAPTHESALQLAEQYAANAALYTQHAESFPLGHPGREANLAEAAKYEHLSADAWRTSQALLDTKPKEPSA